MLMVRVKIKEDETAIGLLVDTHLMTVQGQAGPSMNPEGVLVPGQQQMGLRGFGVVATEQGFLVGPLENMQPIFEPEKELGNEEAEEVPTELRSGE